MERLKLATVWLGGCSGSQFEPSLVDAMHEAFLYGLLQPKASMMYPRIEHRV